VYQPPPATDPEDLALMRRLDELHLKHPFYGSRRMAVALRAPGHGINRKRVQRLMRTMGLEALAPKPGTSRKAPRNRVYPYLLRHLTIDRPDQVWRADVTYVPMAQGFMYLVVIMDWARSCVLAWRLSSTLDASFCVAALEEALTKGKARDLQHRSGRAVHERGAHGRAERGRDRDQHGRARALDGQRLRRTAVARAEARGDPSARLRHRARGAVGGQRADRATSEAKARTADLWACGQRKGVARMRTGPTAAAKSSVIR
jgi:putative transposase